MSDDILFSTLDNRDQKIGVITLNRPKVLNALTYEMIQQMTTHLLSWETDPNISAVLLQQGECKVFCAGGDIRTLYERTVAKDPNVTQFFWEEYQLNYLIARYSKPYISILNGLTMGGGAGISLHGRYIVTTPNFECAMPEAFIGFFPDVGASYFLSQLLKPYGLWMALTGSRINAADAQALGLENSFYIVIPPNALIERLQSCDLSADPQACVAALLTELSTTAPASEVSLTPNLITECFNSDHLVHILEKLQAHPENAALKSLNKASPLSLKIIFEQMKRAKKLDRQDCLKLDFDLVRHFLQSPEFMEGVRAILIDKDKNPVWEFKSIGAVPDERVNRYFDPIEPALNFEAVTCKIP